jgi:hypothetical protein
MDIRSITMISMVMRVRSLFHTIIMVITSTVMTLDHKEATTRPTHMEEDKNPTNLTISTITTDKMTILATTNHHIT